MASATQADFGVTTTWADMAATLVAIASAETLVQNIGPYDVQVVFGGGSAPTATGIILEPLDSVVGTAANVWVRAVESASSVSATVI